MPTSSWNCKGCTNLCHQLVPETGEIGTYCRVQYDQPGAKGCEWVGDNIICLDYTTEPRAEDRQARMWSAPKYKHKVKEEDDATD